MKITKGSEAIKDIVNYLQFSRYYCAYLCCKILHSMLKQWNHNFRKPLKGCDVQPQWICGKFVCGRFRQKRALQNYPNNLYL